MISWYTQPSEWRHSELFFFTKLKFAWIIQKQNNWSRRRKVRHAAGNLYWKSSESTRGRERQWPWKFILHSIMKKILDSSSHLSFLIEKLLSTSTLQIIALNLIENRYKNYWQVISSENESDGSDLCLAKSRKIEEKKFYCVFEILNSAEALDHVIDSFYNKSGADKRVETNTH